uniref:BAH domain-containing protein n=1 Tax=Fagus sylvatica TaxID=28930 RepID=A0A2N9HHZ8_FAGSY
MRPSDPGKASYVAKIDQIEVDGRGSNVKVQVRWYYKPDESIRGRRQFHGEFWFCLLEQADLQI